MNKAVVSLLLLIASAICFAFIVVNACGVITIGGPEQAWLAGGLLAAVLSVLVPRL